MLVLARSQSLGKARASWTSRVSPQRARASPLQQTQQKQRQRSRRLGAMAAMMDVDGAGGAGSGAEETPVASVADLVVGESAAAAQQQQDPQAAVEAVRAVYSGPETVTTFAGVQGWTGAGRRQAWLEAAAKAGTGGADAKIPLEARVFDIGQFLAPGFCKTQVYGRSVLYGHVLKSTQTSIYEHGLGFPEGTLCVADVQTSGKGRGSNEWTSPPGCLLFSYISTVRDGRTLPLVQYLVCIAIVEAIKSLEGLEDAKVGIKWPNDIYYDKSTKIGGILCQSVSMGRTFKVCIGLGLNVDNEDPTTCLNAIGKGPRVSREQVLARILERYEALHTEFEREGFNARLKSAYESAWLHSGQEVMLKDEGGRKVIIEGIAPDSGGCLVARDAFNSSMRFELYPDGNRFDFFQGLISKRM